MSVEKSVQTCDPARRAVHHATTRGKHHTPQPMNVCCFFLSRLYMYCTLILFRTNELLFLLLFHVVLLTLVTLAATLPLLTLHLTQLLEHFKFDNPFLKKKNNFFRFICSPLTGIDCKSLLYTHTDIRGGALSQRPLLPSCGTNL